MTSLKKYFLVIGVTALAANCGSPSSPRYATNTSTNGGNNGGNSGPVTNPGGTPAAPSGLTASASSASQITLNWSDNSGNETSFRIERATNSPFGGVGGFGLLKEVGANVRTFTDSQLNPSTPYYYRVVALNGVLPSSPSNQSSATTQAAPSTPPSPPASLAATATAATVITLSWSDLSNNESYFEIERSNNGGGTFALIGTASANVQTYQDINLNASTSYVYRVRSRNFAGPSTAYSNNGTVTTLAAGNTASYSYIAANIIGPNCVDCHGPGLASAGYNFSSYNLLNGNRNAAMNAINGGRMPPGAPLTSAQIGILNSWINAGAPNN